MKSGRLPLLATLLTASAALLCHEAQAQSGILPQGEDAPSQVVIVADELIHDRALDTVSARGNVEIQYGDYLLRAESVNYSTGRDEATATGSVVLVEPAGTTLFADHMALTGDLKTGVIEELRVLLADGSRMAARNARRTDGRRTEMDHGVYSPCDVCAEDPDRARLWQVKSLRVVHDQERKQITYNHSWLEVLGIPVLYIPYLTHPDPSVKRRSGLLAPSYSSNTTTGTSITTPYYVVIDDQQDMTLSPMMTAKQGLVLGGEYRLRTYDGLLNMEGSITHDRSNRIRNHLYLTAETDLDETWRAGTRVELTSDDTYLRRYGFGAPSVMRTRGYVEGFSGRSYASLEGYRFQTLTTPAAGVTRDQVPLVMPLAEWSLVGTPGIRGGYHTLEASTAILYRERGPQSRRLTTGWGWHLPYIAPTGEVYQLDLGLRGDFYSVERVNDPRRTTPYTGTALRVLPEASLTWSLPLARRHATFNEVIEPIVQGVISPRGQNSGKIPNEDSQDFEFDDTNLFRTNRFTGYDRVETGTRINYGLRYAAYGQSIGQVEVMIGQSYHLNASDIFSPTSGLRDRFSDYVGRILVRPSENVDLLYRFRLDHSNFKSQRNELSAVVGPPLLRTSVTYTSLAANPLQGPDYRQRREEIAVGISSQLTRYWSASASLRNDLGPGGGPRSVGGQITYDDECLTFVTDIRRDYTSDRDYRGGFSVGLRVVFKTLGETATAF